jgi:hypothetical protein
MFYDDENDTYLVKNIDNKYDSDYIDYKSDEYMLGSVLFH